MIVASLAVFVSLSVIVAVAGLLPPASARECNGAPHGPILIKSDANFTPANGVASGTGTPANPFVIANLAINDLRAGYALKVDNSD